MAEKYYFQGQFRCMYCRENFDPEERLSLAAGESTDLKCPKCGAVWKFWVSIQLSHRLVGGGRYNRPKNQPKHNPVN